MEIPMSVLLLLVVPLLAEGTSCGSRDHAGCVLPPASTERFFVTNEAKTWHMQYLYHVPGIYDLGCVTYFQYPGERANEINFTGNFSRVPQFPMEGFVIAYGNRLNEVYYGAWDCFLSGPLNIVFSHQDFIIGHRCFLGYDFAEIYTTAKTPTAELMDLIWKVVSNHTEVDRSKFTRAVC